MTAPGAGADWERIGTDVTHQGPFNASFSLTGQAVPEPSSVILMSIGGTAVCGICLYRRRRRIA